MTGKTLSIVVPVYNEAAVLPELLDRLEAISGNLADEFKLAVGFIFIDDGSSDDSFSILNAHDFGPRPVRLLQFSRNFGKEAALSAGIDAARSADAAVLMDADLQHPPEMITKFVRIWLDEGADSVYAYKVSRHSSEGYLKAAASRVFFWVINRNIRYKIPPGAGDFRLINRRFMKALCSLPESDRFMKGLYGWVGFRQVGLPLAPAVREHGTSSFGALRLLSITMDAITSFTTTPLRLMAMAGIVIAMFSLVYGLYVVIETLFFTGVANGIASVLTLIAFFGGVQMIFLGLLGEYIGKSVQEAKKRPPYILAEDISRKGDVVEDR
ncbi:MULTISPECIES: glycosyltransferase family 2 protein [Hoeflea]|uniref:Glycosyltransferase n=1 Tax=Hoeflea alexandrii TaxID=288436 RepID=A0ABT1CSZ2_9HYPH|nr:MULTISPECIES: glycosyltransferase family 2 protein [Hoeflea]MCO6409312.1 glycosyltransferase [Hoeflea alexandrii]VVT28287.1 Glycosyltransferase [Hoeflea sp. EC-HK425]